MLLPKSGVVCLVLKGYASRMFLYIMRIDGLFHFFREKTKRTKTESKSTVDVQLVIATGHEGICYGFIRWNVSASLGSWLVRSLYIHAVYPRKWTRFWMTTGHISLFVYVSYSISFSSIVVYYIKSLRMDIIGYPSLLRPHNSCLFIKPNAFLVIYSPRHPLCIEYCLQYLLCPGGEE